MATAHARALPDFLIIGAQRGGTSSLFGHLAHHPGVLPASTKEVHYFDVFHWKGSLWYRSHFPLRSELRRAGDGLTRLTGEATPSYLFHPRAPARMKYLLPHARLIVLLRNPVERAHSHWRLMSTSGRERLTFEEAIDEERRRVKAQAERLGAGRRTQVRRYLRYSYLGRGIYADQLERWFDEFPRERFLILKSEDFFQDPTVGFQEVGTFLGLPEHQSFERGRTNTAPGPPLAASTRAQLGELYAPHNHRLYELLGRDLGWQ